MAVPMADGLLVLPKAECYSRRIIHARRLFPCKHCQSWHAEKHMIERCIVWCTAYHIFGALLSISSVEIAAFVEAGGLPTNFQPSHKDHSAHFAQVWADELHLTSSWLMKHQRAPEFHRVSQGILNREYVVIRTATPFLDAWYSW